jgi:hypothetical protein
MPHPFDAVNKHMIQAHPADFNDYADLPAGTSVRVVDADLSTISAAADKLILVDGPNPYAAHHEIQSGPRPNLDLDMLFYNVLGRRIHGVPVKSVVTALRPSALSGSIGGVFDTADPQHKLEFSYKVIRVWELPPQRLLSGGIGTLPLAPISAVTEAQLPAVIEAVARRIEREAAPQEVPELWTCTRILMGIRWPRQVIHQVLKGARQMKDSVVYQEILEEGMEKGRVAEARLYLLRRGAKKLGIPDASVHSRLDMVSDASTLEELTDRVLDGSFATWAELLASLA